MRNLATTALTILLASTLSSAFAQDLTPADVRRVALDAGLGSLRRAKVPKPSNLGDFLRSGSKARDAAIQLGKALYWDEQVGSDGQACASCHFHAGADSRTKNQLSPGFASTRFDPTATGGGGPNTQLSADDFPFHQLEDVLDRTSAVLHDSDDVCSSQGVFAARFAGVLPGRPSDAGIPLADAVFNVGGVGVRRVEPRNAPSVINAVFNFENFWDGRARSVFNGSNAAGPLDPSATVLVYENGALTPRAVRIDNASLASQAVEPPASDFEMAFSGRRFRDLGRKLLRLRPLGGQLVHPKDGVLGSQSRAKLSRGVVVGKPGLSPAYADLIKRAFEPRYWQSSKKVDGYSQMEANFSLFFGLALQMYESTLVSDRTPFDRFMEGDDGALTDVQRQGLLVFVNRGDRPDDPILSTVSQGNCVACHAGPELTSAAARDVLARGAAEVARTAELQSGELVVGDQTAFRDHGFANLGVRPTVEDIGRGGVVLGMPVSFVRQRLLGFPFAPALPGCGGPGQEPCPESQRVGVDGAFKVPGLRNVELTGPFFHDGGEATLRQVILFYERQGDFSNENVANLDPELGRIHFIEDDEDALVEFLQSLTDDRVRDERAPFDHPELFVPNGHPGDRVGLTCTNGPQACDDLLGIPAVGASGRRAAGLPQLETFLGL